MEWMEWMEWMRPAHADQSSRERVEARYPKFSVGYILTSQQRLHQRQTASRGLHFDLINI